MAKKNYYAVAVGRNPGIYNKWYGEDEAEAQVSGFPNAVFKGFPTRKEAEDFLEERHAHQPEFKFKFKSSKTDIKPKKDIHKNRSNPTGWLFTQTVGVSEIPAQEGMVLF